MKKLSLQTVQADNPLVDVQLAEAYLNAVKDAPPVQFSLESPLGESVSGFQSNSSGRFLNAAVQEPKL